MLLLGPCLSIATVAGLALGIISAGSPTFFDLLLGYAVAFGCTPFVKELKDFEFVTVLSLTMLGMLVSALYVSSYGYVFLGSICSMSVAYFLVKVNRVCIRRRKGRRDLRDDMLSLPDDKKNWYA
jgi:hypothetical protein